MKKTDAFASLLSSHLPKNKADISTLSLEEARKVKQEEKSFIPSKVSNLAGKDSNQWDLELLTKATTPRKTDNSSQSSLPLSRQDSGYKA